MGSICVAMLIGSVSAASVKIKQWHTDGTLREFTDPTQGLTFTDWADWSNPKLKEIRIAELVAQIDKCQDGEWAAIKIRTPSKEGFLEKEAFIIDLGDVKYITQPHSPRERSIARETDKKILGALTLATDYSEFGERFSHTVNPTFRCIGEY